MSPPAGTRGPYAKTVRLRARAIEFAIDLFGSTGYNGATLTEVADRLGMSLTGLQHHFPDKDSLLAAVLEERDLRASHKVPAGFGSGVFESLLVMLSENQNSPGLMDLQCVLSAEATSAEHPAHNYFQRRYSTFREQARIGFEEMAARGELESDIEPALLASMVVGMVDGLQLQWLLDRDSVNVEAGVRRFLRTFIPAIQPTRIQNPLDQRSAETYMLCTSTV